MSAVGKQSHPTVLCESYWAVPESIPRARRALVTYAERRGADEEQLDALRLAASEAITNAVRHAYRDGEHGLVHVTAAVAGGELWILVADDGRGLDGSSANPGLGMGLALIAAVTDHLAILRRASGGTEVRMRIRLSAEAPADGHLRGSFSSARRPA